jgi:hypothetical protein
MDERYFAKIDSWVEEPPKCRVPVHLHTTHSHANTTYRQTQMSLTILEGVKRKLDDNTAPESRKDVEDLNTWESSAIGDLPCFIKLSAGRPLCAYAHKPLDLGVVQVLV